MLARSLSLSLRITSTHPALINPRNLYNHQQVSDPEAFLKRLDGEKLRLFWPALPRTEIVKQLWAYIRKNNLQDPGNKRKIICNEELRLSVPKKPKVAVESGTKSTELGPSLIISEALANFFGVGVREMLQSEVLMRIWEYIKVNHLENILEQRLLCRSEVMLINFFQRCIIVPLFFHMIASHTKFDKKDGPVHEVPSMRGLERGRFLQHTVYVTGPHANREGFWQGCYLHLYFCDGL